MQDNTVTRDYDHINY